jgi:hypothetical protein
MGSAQLAPCQWWSWVQTFGYRQTVLSWDAWDYPSIVGRNMLEFPNSHFGLLDSQDDVVISEYFGWGQNQCTGTTPLTAQEFEAGEAWIEQAFAWAPNFSGFFFAGSRHTSLDNSLAFDTTTAMVEGTSMSMTAWAAQLIGP